MTPIVIPTGVSDKDKIQQYVRRNLAAKHKPIKQQSNSIPPPPNKPAIEIPGDDWTTDTKGLHGKAALRRYFKTL